MEASADSQTLLAHTTTGFFELLGRTQNEANVLYKITHFIMNADVNIGWTICATDGSNKLEFTNVQGITESPVASPVSVSVLHIS